MLGVIAGYVHVLDIVNTHELNIMGFDTLSTSYHVDNHNTCFIAAENTFCHLSNSIWLQS